GGAGCDRSARRAGRPRGRGWRVRAGAVSSWCRDCAARAAHSGAAALLRRRPELLAGPGHRPFPVGAGLLPAFAANRHGAAALAPAAVVASRSLALVARSLAGALAGVEAAADVRVLEPGPVVRLGGLGGVQGPLQAGGEQRAG